ncbi:MAG: Rv3235 family protein [Arachnia sp.]
MFTQLSAQPIPSTAAPEETPRPDPAPPAAVALIAALIEAMTGRRPLHQLRPHMTATSFLTLVTYADSGAFKRSRSAGLRTQRPFPGAVEASLRLQAEGRWISCVLRLDVHGRSWLCSEVAVLEPFGSRTARAA